ncbi:MAG: helix-turn-helix domain-containing protein [Candidatus Buchananbacteria bacterium]|jgi:transcriptional regulator with XRE-family HTH domain|nr:helix-turn-helix domain-containing protein [Candidatus Buchananbacteria bacterium]
MAIRTHKIATLQSVGAYLRAARHERGVSLDTAARELLIPFKYLEALEHDRSTALPKDEAPELRRRYAEYVGLDAAALDRVAADQGQVPGRKLMLTARQTRRLVVVLGMIAIAIFLVIKIERIFLPPMLAVEAPADGTSVGVPQLVVNGRSEPEAEVVINNKPVPITTEGRFETTIDLQKGLNLIKITAKKRYGRSVTEELHVLYRDDVEE